MTAPARQDARSLSQRIRDDIEQNIMTGVWKPGDRIPVERELAAQYACARMTVTRATEALAETGLIVRRKRAGSFVGQPRVESAVLDIPNIQADIAARGKVAGYRLLSRRQRVPRDCRHEVLLSGRGDLLEIECLHLADDSPFAFEHRLISLGAVPAAAAADFSAIAPGNWLLDQVPWTQAEHRIGAGGADKCAADALSLGLGAPCLILERLTWRGDTHITRVRQVFPAGQYDLVARFTPSSELRT
ncbi:MAG: histidine utilization repressor [Sphingomonadales bacterium]